MIDLRAEIEVSGGLFREDVRRSVRHRLGEAVEELSVHGAELVRESLRRGIRSPTGQTAAGVEGFSYRRGMYANGSLFGKVRMREGLTREPGSAAYPAARRPYIVNRVLESGGYGGQRVQKTRRSTGRRYTGWQRGSLHRRQALHQFRNAAKVMRQQARAMGEAIAARIAGDLD